MESYLRIVCLDGCMCYWKVTMCLLFPLAYKFLCSEQKLWLLSGSMLKVSSFIFFIISHFWATSLLIRHFDGKSHIFFFCDCLLYSVYIHQITQSCTILITGIHGQFIECLMNFFKQMSERLPLGCWSVLSLTNEKAALLKWSIVNIYLMYSSLNDDDVNLFKSQFEIIKHVKESDELNKDLNIYYLSNIP